MYGSDEFGGGSVGVGVVAHPGPSPSFMVFDAPREQRERVRHASQSRHNTHLHHNHHNTPNSATGSSTVVWSPSTSSAAPSSSSTHHNNTLPPNSHRRQHHGTSGGDERRSRSRTTSESRRASSPNRSAAAQAAASSASASLAPHLPHTSSYTSDSSSVSDEHHSSSGTRHQTPQTHQHQQQHHQRRAPSPLKLISPTVNSGSNSSAASHSHTRPTTPKFTQQHTQQPSRPSSRASSVDLQQRSRIPTPNRLRSNSSGANLLSYSDTETLADLDPPPPLPSYRPDSRQQQHQQAFPLFPASPSTPVHMSSLSSSHAAEAPHRLAAGGVPLGSTPPSGIPVLKSRTRSNPRPPSPEFPAAEESLRDAAPPFRVDLDATLAEIEDELEARAAERYMLAKPGPTVIAPRTPSAPTTPITPHSRSSRNGAGGGANGTTGSVSNRPKRRISQNHQSPKASVTTPLGRSATLNGHSSPMGSVGRSTPNSRKRHGSDSAGVALGTPKTPRTPRATAAVSTPKVRASVDTPPSNLGTTPPAQKHIGIAAHFIPPENNYTPPKGADWDDVVLPTVARKTGISVARQGDDDGPSGDDDLAVEWDKDGNPVRWESQTRERREREDRGPVSYSSDFGPSFARPGRREPESIELTPIRAPAGQATALEPSSPAPNSRRQSRVPSSAVGTEHRQPSSAQQPQAQADSFSPAPFSPPPKAKKRRDHSDEVKAGCGCVIM